MGCVARLGLSYTETGGMGCRGWAHGIGMWRGKGELGVLFGCWRKEPQLGIIWVMEWMEWMECFGREDVWVWLDGR